MEIPSVAFQIAILFCYCLFLRCFVVYVHRYFLNPLSQIPGPLGAKFSDWYCAYHSALGQLHIKTWAAHERYGSVVRLGPNKITFNTVTALHTIYHTKMVQKSRGYIALNSGTTNTHSTIDKEIHRFKRKVINVGLSESCMRAFEPTMNIHIRKYISKLGTGLAKDEWSTPINMTECFKYLGYDVMSEFTFGQSFQLQDNDDKRFVPESVILSGKIMGAYLQFPDLEKVNLHLLFARQASASRKQWMNLTSQVVRDRVAKGKKAQHDLFSFVVDAKDPETRKGFSMDELFDEARLLLVGGSDTSSTTLAALMFYLSRYPLCYEKLTTEIRSTFQSTDDIQSGPRMNQCTYLRACIEEALRMSPPIASSLWREVSPGTGGLNIDGLYVPEGTEVGVSSYVIHHNEEYFPDSFTFNPERWIISASNPKEKVDLAKRAFAPFSLGSRGCPGRVMAYMEISNVLAQTVWYFDFTAPEGKMKQIGEGKPDGQKERRRKLEFQLQDHLISSHDGPYLRFKLR